MADKLFVHQVICFQDDVRKRCREVLTCMAKEEQCLQAWKAKVRQLLSDDRDKELYLYVYTSAPKNNNNTPSLIFLHIKILSTVFPKTALFVIPEGKIPFHSKETDSIVFVSKNFSQRTRCTILLSWTLFL